MEIFKSEVRVAHGFWVGGELVDLGRDFHIVFVEGRFFLEEELFLVVELIDVLYHGGWGLVLAGSFDVVFLDFGDIADAWGEIWGGVPSRTLVIS